MRWIVAVIVAASWAGCGPSQADGDRTCASTGGCKTFRKCRYDSGQMGYGSQAKNGVYDSQCIARPEDCRGSEEYVAELRACMSR